MTTVHKAMKKSVVVGVTIGLVLSLSFIKIKREIEKRNLPKVGECFLNNIKGFREIRKIIAIHPDNKHNEISYVYNFLDDPKFERGRWYILEPLTTTSSYLFFTKYVSKVDCNLNHKEQL